MIRPALLVAVGLSLLAQSERTGVISGTVVDDANGDPVRKAVVVLTWLGTLESYATAMSDGSGNFSFDSLPAGTYVMRAAIRGVQWRPSDFITLGAGKHKSGVRIAIGRPCSISGRVFDAEGDPVRDATVVASVAGEEMFPRRQARTDSNGEYRLGPLVPGRYFVAVLGAPRVGDNGQMTIMLPTTFYAGATDLRQANRVILRSGDRLQGIDITRAGLKSVTVSGRVLGAPVPAPGDRDYESQGARITVRRQFTAGIDAHAFTGTGPPDYRFKFELAPGEYLVLADAQKGRLSGRHMIRVGEDPAEISILVGPRADITGQVAGTASLGGSKVVLVGANLQMITDEVRAAIEKDGKFSFEQIEPGPWEVAVRDLPPGLYVDSIRFGGQPATGRSIDIAPAGRGPLIITLNPNGGTVTGKVEADAAKLRGYPVLMVRTDDYSGPAETLFRIRSDPQGKFRFEGVPPGRYRIAVLEPPVPPELVSDEAERAMAKLGVDVEVRAGAVLEVKPPVVQRDRMMQVLE